MLSVGSVLHADPAMTPYDLRCEYLDDPLGIDVIQPRLFWKLTPPADRERRGMRQSAYRILVAGSPELLAEETGDLWDTGYVEGDRNTQVDYAGAPLSSGRACFWKVRVWDESGNPSPWSEVATWTMGLLEPEDWEGDWIGTDYVNDVPTEWWSRVSNSMPDPWFRKSFTIDEIPGRALLYVGSMGYHEATINGQPVSDGVLAPNVSHLDKRVLYNTYDVTALLQPGENVIGLWLGTAWSIFPQYQAQTEDKPLVIAQLDLDFPGGREAVVTDGSWKTHASPNTLLGIWFFQEYGGERYDMNAEVPGWNKPGFDASGWDRASRFSPAVTLTADRAEPNRIVETIEPVAIIDASLRLFPGNNSSEFVDVKQVDMGVAFTGWSELTVRGDPGQTIRFYFSERPEDLLTYDQRSELVLGPDGAGTFRNRFNYASYRYVAIEGLDYEPELSDFRGYLVRTDYRRATEFHCTHPLLRQINDAVRWTFECLSLGGYVVDCAHRERMGYGGDAHSTTDMALRHYDLGAFYSKWIEDWRDVQHADGSIENTAPTVWGGGGPAWGGYCITLPWELYQTYGDTRVLEENYPMMRDWLGFLQSHLAGDILQRYGGNFSFLGDWVPPGGVPSSGDTPEAQFFNNGYMVHNLDMAADVADVLGHSGDAAGYRALADRMRTAVHDAFYDADTRSYVNGRQAYLAMALLADLMPESEREAVWNSLRNEIEVRQENHIDTGITGTWALIKTLIDHGRSEWVYPMATQDDFPSWGHMLKSGSNVIWEKWEREGSLMHSSFLYLGAWFVEALAGIQPDPTGPGFRRFFIKPTPMADLNAASARYESIHGEIVSDWGLAHDEIRLDVTVPPNTTATVHLPTSDPAHVLEGGEPVSAAPGVTPLAAGPDHAVFEVGSGRYSFLAAYAGTPPVPSGYEDWVVTWMGRFIAGEGFTGEGDDPDADGSTNLLEYALDGEPLRNEGPAVTARRETVAGIHHLCLTYDRAPDRGDLEFMFETAPAADGPWKPIDEPTPHVQREPLSDSGRERVTLRMPAEDATPQRFFRLKVRRMDVSPDS